MKWLIVVLILATVLIAGCTQSTGINSVTAEQCTFRDELINRMQKFIIERTERNPNGESWNFYVYPNETEVSGYNRYVYAEENSGILDTNFFNDAVYFYCKNGTETGENIYYLYCSNNQGGFAYGKDIIDSSGKILEKQRYLFSASPVLDSNLSIVNKNNIICRRVI